MTFIQRHEQSLGHLKCFEYVLEGKIDVTRSLIISNIGMRMD